MVVVQKEEDRKHLGTRGQYKGVIAITVEEEDDIVKFSDYKASSTSSSGGAKSSPEPSPPKKRRSLVKGTGPDGSIVKDDIDDYLASKASAPKDKATTQASNLDYTELPHTQITKITASHLLQSKQTIPHYYLTADSCVDKLMELRSKFNFVQEDSGGKHISVNDLVVKAAALALRKVPQCSKPSSDGSGRRIREVALKRWLTIAPVAPTTLWLTMSESWDMDNGENIVVAGKKKKEACKHDGRFPEVGANKYKEIFRNMWEKQSIPYYNTDDSKAGGNFGPLLDDE
ncbi:hypothetical protein C5167_018317 [Papaver somniferum]|uniref:2-oxoacid dehydrogenase acyltransferase catalytic domain-containing protein n=1 Tax=Papaver somniferum TaxID=3469 RepID=A0A4Y7ILW7_PAPSO|nr:hypothetical protein C5167_018317 [Papaver somniferum]